MNRVIVAIGIWVLLALGALAGCIPPPELPASRAPAIVAVVPATEPGGATMVVSGTIVDALGPVGGAIIQAHGEPTQTLAAPNGAFSLGGLVASKPITLTAWAAGHYVGWTIVEPAAPNWNGGAGITITLKLLPEKDNHEYPWFSFEGVKGSASCGLCHREYVEWQADAHSQAATNSRFISVYTGKDVRGRENQLVQWSTKGTALPPDPSKPYYGPGFQGDNPGRAGNCATCHTPVASKTPNRTNCGWSGCHTDLTIERSKGIIDPHTIPLPTSGEGLEGITCDFCHKIGEVTLDSKTRLPPPDMPGILSYRLYRPEEGQQIFFGTLVDVPRRDSYLPLLAQSEYCAPCHYGVFGGVVGTGTVTSGTVIYNSYGEWLDSPYSDPKTGRTCQQCHMPVSPAKWFVFPERGGLTRDWAELHDHRMPGAADEKLLQNSVTMTTTAQHTGDQLQVEVRIVNDQTGHHIPTDAPMRQMILVVEATDAAGKALTLHQGPVNPAWAGDLAQRPGKTFMKVLKDEWTGETPTAAYWRPVSIVEDTRLAALAADTTRYTFALPTGQAAQVKARLIFRRNYQALMKQKGFTDPDVLMEEVTLQVAK